MFRIAPILSLAAALGTVGAAVHAWALHRRAREEVVLLPMQEAVRAPVADSLYTTANARLLVLDPGQPCFARISGGTASGTESVPIDLCSRLPRDMADRMRRTSYLDRRRVVLLFGERVVLSSIEASDSLRIARWLSRRPSSMAARRAGD